MLSALSKIVGLAYGCGASLIHACDFARVLMWHSIWGGGRGITPEVLAGRLCFLHEEMWDMRKSAEHMLHGCWVSRCHSMALE